jgi:hypothetical protein
MPIASLNKMNITFRQLNITFSTVLHVSAKNY